MSASGLLLRGGALLLGLILTCWASAARADPPAAKAVADVRSRQGGGAASDDDDEPDEPPIDVLVQAPNSPLSGGADSTTARYVLRRRDLTGAGTSLMDVVARAPSVQVTRAGGSTDLASLSLRGSASGQLPVYLGGVRLDDELTGSIDLSSIPMWLLDRVELHRGHSPRQADRFGVGGALMLVPRLLRRSGASAGLAMGSFGLRSAQASGGIGDGRASALMALRYQRGTGNFSFADDRGTLFDDSDDIRRQRTNADHQQLDAWSTGRMALPGGQLSLLAHGFWREAGVPGVQLIGTRRARSEAHRFVAAASSELDCGAGRTSERAGCRLLVDSGLLVSRYRLDDPLRETGPQLQTVTQGQRVSQRLRAELTPSKRLTLWLGAGLQGGRLVQQLQGGVSRHATRVVLRPELALSAEPVSGLLLNGAGALSCHTTASDSGATSCGVLEPAGRLGVQLKPILGLSLFANAGRYVRVPTLGELYGVTATVRGNDALLPERGVTIDAGIDVQGQHHNLTGFAQLVGFARWADDLIAYRRSSLGAVRPYNAQQARVMGLEGVVGGQLGRLLDVRAALSWIDPRDTSDDNLSYNLLPLRARLIGHGRIALRTPGWRSIGLAYAEIAGDYQHRSSRSADPAGLIVLPAQHQIDLELALRWRRPQLALRGRVSNLADQRTVDLLGYPLPGRAYYGSMEATW